MSKVPKNFHFVFGLNPQQEPFHLAHYLCIASCIAVNKPDAVYFHYKYLPFGSWWERIAPYLILNKVTDNEFIQTYKYQNRAIEKFRYAHWADIIRLEMLYQYGGIYADIDTLFIHPLPHWFYEKPFIMGKEKTDWKEKAAQEAGGSLCNAWILSEKKADFAKLWLKQLYQSFDGSWSAHSTFLPYKLSKQYPSLIHIEPERSFFYFDWTKEGLRNIFERNITELEGIYSIHLWSHLWWDKHRTDFSFFHHKRLTTHYVRHSSSTYSSEAKKFLPPSLGTSKQVYKKEKLEALIENVFYRIKQKI